VALKLLLPEFARDAAVVERFEQEARIAAGLRHPNIVTIYDIGEDDGRRYIAMEYVRGKALHQVLERYGGLGIGGALSLLTPIAAALDFAHDRQAVHCDVKPHNMLVGTDGRVVLTDFGVAQAPNNRRLTVPGEIIGTPEYLAPEQISGHATDDRTDLYALGVVCYEIITGALPFNGTLPELLLAHVGRTPPPARAIDTTLPPEIDRVLARALAKRRDDRFSSGRMLVAALDIVARKYGIAPLRPEEIAALALPANSDRGMVTTAAITLTGHPRDVALHQGYAALTFEDESLPPPLPDSLPAPRAQRVRYHIYIERGRWRRLAQALAGEEARLTVHGFPVYDPQRESVTVFATEATVQLNGREHVQND